MKTIITAFGILLFAPLPMEVSGEQPQRLTPFEAYDHLGEESTVCGSVVSTRYNETAQGKPVFLNFERPYPDQPFTAVILGEIRDNFPEPPEVTYADRRICVTGKIDEFNGLARIIVPTSESVTSWMASDFASPTSVRAFEDREFKPHLTNAAKVLRLGKFDAHRSGKLDGNRGGIPLSIAFQSNKVAR